MYIVREIGLVHGRRKTEFAEVPSKILGAGWNKVKLIIRGFADTYGSLFFGKKGTYQKHSYPTIEMRSASLRLLIQQFQTILRENGFAPYLRKTFPHYESKASFLYLSGKEQLSKWIKEIGFRNPKHLTKYQVWKKMGFCPPRTNLRHRLQLLNVPGWQSG